MDSQDVMLGRIDERTKQLLDSFIEFKKVTEDKEAEQDRRLDAHDQWKAFVVGGAVLFTTIAGLAATLASGLIHFK